MIACVIAKFANPAADVVVAQMEHAEIEPGSFLGNSRRETNPAEGELGAAGGENLLIFTAGVVAVDRGLARIVFEQSADRVMGADFFPINLGGPDRTRVDVRSIALRRDVAFGCRQSLREFAFQRRAEKVFR